MLHVQAHFEQNEDAPIIPEQFGVYICTYVDLRRILRDIPRGAKLCPGSLRYDPGWGFGNDALPNSPREIDAPQITAKGRGVRIRWRGIGRLMRAVRKTGMPSLFVHAYNPIPLQPTSAEPRGGNSQLTMRSLWNTLPTDLARWGEIVKAYARRWHDHGPSLRYHEIWNEPDLQPTFFTGSIEDYCAIYASGAKAVRSGDPDGLVGGPSVSFSEEWASEFLGAVRAQRLPMDFFSYHAYGDPAPMVEKMREALRSHPWMRTKEVLMTEYNVFVPATPDFTTGGGIETSACAAMLLDAFDYFLRQPDIHQVHWAQLQDPEVFGENVDRCGLLDLKGFPKPAYLAWRLFTKLSSQRRRLELSDPIHGMAAADANGAQVLLWNRSMEPREVVVDLLGVPFACRQAEITTLDGKDEQCRTVPFALEEPSLSFRLEAHGVCLIRLASVQRRKVSRRRLPVARVLRYTHDFGAGMYAEYDKRRRIVYLGSGAAPAGPAWIGLVMKKLVQRLRMTVELEATSENLGFSIYALGKDSGVCFHKAGGNSPPVPWECAQIPMTYRAWAGEGIEISDAHALLFCFEDTAPHARARVVLG